MNVPTHYAQNQGLRLLRDITDSYGPLFTTEQAHAIGNAHNISPDRVNQLLSILTHSGWIARLKRGVYAVQTSLLSNDVHPFAIANALISPSAISHWSALAHHGLTSQIPPMVQSSTPKKVVTPEMRHGESYRPRGRTAWRVLNLEFEFIHVKQDLFFGFTKEWVSSWHRIRISDPERTLLDTFAHQEIFGGITFAMETLDSSMAMINIERLTQYALQYDVGSVIKRLGWILETLGVSRDILIPLKSYPVRNDYILDLQRPHQGLSIRDWRIINNLPGLRQNA